MLVDVYLFDTYGENVQSGCLWAADEPAAHELARKYAEECPEATQYVLRYVYKKQKSYLRDTKRGMRHAVSDDSY